MNPLLLFIFNVFIDASVCCCLITKESYCLLYVNVLFQYLCLGCEPTFRLPCDSGISYNPVTANKLLTVALTFQTYRQLFVSGLLRSK